jgi:hypothetical protein
MERDFLGAIGRSKGEEREVKEEEEAAGKPESESGRSPLPSALAPDDLIGRLR